MTNAPRANSSVSVMYKAITSSLEEQPSTARVSLSMILYHNNTRIRTYVRIFQKNLRFPDISILHVLPVNTLPYLTGHTLASMTSPASILVRASTLFSAFTIAPRQI